MPTAAIATTLMTKITVSWITSELNQWIKTRSTTATEQRTWTEISNKILKQTKTTAERYKKTNTIAFPRDPVFLNDIYTPLTLENRRINKTAIIDKFPHEILSEHRKTLIVDAAGMGKSTISKIIFIKSLEENKHLPVLIDLRRLDGSEEIENCLSKQFGLKQKHSDLFSEFLSTQPLLFIFDGFDEVPEGRKAETARTIRHFIDRSENGTFIITSRPELPFSDYTDFTTFNIKELNKDEAFSLIRKYGNAYNIPDRAKSLIDELRANHDDAVESFLKNPLLTSLIFRAFEYKSVVPVKRGVFYRQVFDALYESHDLNKETGYVREKKTGLHHDDFHRSTRALAKLFREKRVVEVSKESFLDMARKVSKELCPDLAFKPEDLLHDLLHSVPIFIKDGNLVRWAHKSLLDYFLCEFLLRDFAESKEAALDSASRGIKALSNENLLVLINEADPILFAKSITLPAINKLISRHEQISSKIPDDIPRETANHISTFFTCYEVVFAKNLKDIIGLHINKEEIPDTIENLVPRLIYDLGPEIGGVGIYSHNALVALEVPMQAGTVPFVTGFSITSNYPITKDSQIFKKPGETRFFVSSRQTRKDWDTAEEEFIAIMGLIGKAEIKIATKENLESAKRNLEARVSTSLKARSNDLF